MHFYRVNTQRPLEGTREQKKIETNAHSVLSLVSAHTGYMSSCSVCTKYLCVLCVCVCAAAGGGGCGSGGGVLLPPLISPVSSLCSFPNNLLNSAHCSTTTSIRGDKQ